MIKSFKSTLKNLYKKTIVYIFKKIYKTPKIIKQGLKDSTCHEYKLKIGNKNHKIFKLVGGTIFTDSNDTTAFISKNRYLTEASMQYAKFDKINSINKPLKKNETLITGTPKFKKRFTGNVLSLLSGGASKDNFTHWFSDVIPRLKIFNSKFNLKIIDKFYVPSLKYNFQIESLETIGIKKKKIITSDKYKHITADNIFATSHPCEHVPTKIKKWSLDFLRKKYLKRKKYFNYSKIFIDRDQFKLLDLANLEKFKNYRVLLNEKEIKTFLISRGFRIIKPQNYSLLDQVKIFSNAKIIVGLYGAAMMMISFCKKNTKIIEIKPSKGGNEFKNISIILKLRHRQINLKPKLKTTTPQNGLLVCPIDRIEKEIRS